MPQTLKENGICAEGMCSFADSIPTSLDIGDEIDRHVTQPNLKLAEEIAAWAVKAYREKIARERVSGGTLVPFPWKRDVLSLEVEHAVDQILIRKGWHFSHNFVTNKVFIMPTTPSDGKGRYGPAPSY